MCVNVGFAKTNERASQGHLQRPGNTQRDSTASLLSWIFYFLSRYPRVFNQLRTTVLAEIGTDASTTQFTKLRSCQYLQHCINETLRTGIVPTMERESLEDIWGDDPEVFRPERLAAGPGNASVVSCCTPLQYRRIC